MIVKRSVTSSIAHALAAIVILSVLSTGLALFTLFGSTGDAEAINIAGSLRMQSHRLAWQTENPSESLQNALKIYQKTLDAPLFQRLDRFYVPKAVYQRYQHLRTTWPPLRRYLLDGQPAQYRQHVNRYVNDIDHFVLALQHYAELKIRLVALSCFSGFLAIVLLAIWTIRRCRRQIVKPLNALVTASRHIQRGHFSYPTLPTALPNELGVLASAFTGMSAELEKYYLLLEKKVAEQTKDLQIANRTLTILYEASQTLNAGHVRRPLIAQVLKNIVQHEQLQCIELSLDDNENIRHGEPDATLCWQTLSLRQQKKQFGKLRWQSKERQPQPRLMRSIANMLARSVRLSRTQKQYQQLLLMEERAIIARELHDSLAQSLAFLRIQMTLLKGYVAQSNEKAQQIITDFAQALADAHHQLRELLTTFRLSIDEAKLDSALQAIVEPLQKQTTAQISIDCQLNHAALDAAQQVHVLQIVREALLNAIRHANATHIAIRCVIQNNKNYLFIIEDNGVGLPNKDAPPGHYGLTLMAERAASLNGQLKIQSRPGDGTRLLLSFPVHPAGTANDALI